MLSVCCDCCCLQVYGGAAQDFGAYKTSWETYGWSLFKLSASGLDPDVNWAWIQVGVAGERGSAQAVYAHFRVSKMNTLLQD